MKILVLNGPNLDLLGEREPEIYGTETLDQVRQVLETAAAESGVEIEFLQSNHEGVLIDFLNGPARSADGAIINPGALTHYSFALRDAIAAFGKPVIEVHITNIFSRDDWRSRSVTGGTARAVISGLGTRGYVLALDALVAMLA